MSLAMCSLKHSDERVSGSCFEVHLKRIEASALVDARRNDSGSMATSQLECIKVARKGIVPKILAPIFGPIGEKSRSITSNYSMKVCF